MKAPFFHFYPGDYLADTMGLSCCQHGVYLLLLAVSWQRGPLPDDMDHLARLAANPPIEALRYILETYWSLSDRGWVNARLELEREKLLDKSAKATASARARWGDADAMRTHSGRNADAMLFQIPDTRYQKKDTPLPPKRCADHAFAQFWAAYPRKTDKQRAHTTWERLSKADQSSALADISAGRFADKDPQYIPHPTTYLRGRRWEDENSARSASIDAAKLAQELRDELARDIASGKRRPIE